MKRNLVLGIALSLGVASTALAGGGKGDGKAGRWFDRLDTNGDSVITQTEVNARQTERFNEKDTDGDGMISFEEYSARSQERFARADGDGNGEVTKEEFTAAMKEWRKKHKESE